MTAKSDISRLFEKYESGNREALDELFPIVYGELRRLAASRLRGERADHTLQPTALVHEAYLRLMEQHTRTWRNRLQFFGLAAEMMRRILVNHAVKRNADKRFGHRTQLELDDIADFADRRNIDLTALDEALDELAKFDPQQAQIIELKFFAGLKTEEIAVVVGVSVSTVKREWRIAKAWLYGQLNCEPKAGNTEK